MKKNINFVFPANNDLDELKELLSVQDIQKKMKALFSRDYPMMLFPFKIFEKDGKTGKKVFCYCRNCKAKMVYKQLEDETWLMTIFKTDHSHDLRKPKIKSSQDTVNVYENFIKSFDPLPERKNLLGSMKELFKISNPTFYKVYNRVLQQRNSKTFEELMLEIEDEYDISYCPLPLGKFKYPSQLILTNQSMKELYGKFGKLISFDLTFNVVKDVPLEFDDKGNEIEKKQYQIGFFAGQNNFCNTIIFAVAITSSGRKPDYEILIDSFISLMGGVPPKTIVSDQDTGLIACMEGMR